MKPLLQSLLSFFIQKIWTSSSGDVSILDIDKYQFHFSSFEYRFDIKPLHEIIQYPNGPLNISLDIDFNDTISLSIPNRDIVLDFFNLYDFSEITYTSSIQRVAGTHSLSPPLDSVNLSNSEFVSDNVSDTDPSRRRLPSRRRHARPPRGYRGRTSRSRRTSRNRKRSRGRSAASKKRSTTKGGRSQGGRSSRRSRDRGRSRRSRRSSTRKELDRLKREMDQDIALQKQSNNKMRNFLRRRKRLRDKYGGVAVNPRKTPYRKERYIGYPQRKSWFMAQQFCAEQHGTYLASIMNTMQLHEARHVCDTVAGNGHCWVGLHRPFGTWQDGKPAVFEHWPAGGVNNDHEKPLNCVELLRHKRQLSPNLCTATRSFICETPRERTRGKYIAVAMLATWESAREHCQRTYNTDLASIVDPKENQMAMELCGDIQVNGKHCWVGLMKPFQSWTDGTPADDFDHFKSALVMDHKNFNINGVNPNNGKMKQYISLTPGQRERRGMSRYVSEGGGAQSEAVYVPPKECTTINSAYEGRWDKSRCSFRHYFLCNNPAYKKSDDDDEAFDKEGGDTKKRDCCEQGLDTPCCQRRRRRMMMEEEGTEEEEEEFLIGALIGGAVKGAMGGVMGGGAGAARGGMGGGYQGQNPQTAAQLSQTTNGIRDLRYKMSRNEDLQRRQHQELQRELREIKNAQRDQKRMIERNTQKATDRYNTRTRSERRRRQMERERRRTEAFRKLSQSTRDRINKRMRSRSYGRSSRSRRRHSRRSRRSRRRERHRDSTYSRSRIDSERREYGEQYGRYGNRAQYGGQYGSGGYGARYGMRPYGMGRYGGYGGGRYGNGDRWRRMYYSLMRRYRRGRERWRRRYARRAKMREQRMQQRLRRMYGPRRPQDKCGKHCFKHVPIRTLPRDMHWTPLSGLLPMFGTKALHRPKPKKQPKIHIVAKVHVDRNKHDNGYFDYELLDHLLFPENEGTATAQNKKTKDTLAKYDRNELDMEQQMKDYKHDLDENQFILNRDRKERTFEKQKHRDIDAINDQRATEIKARRRLLKEKKDRNIKTFDDAVYVDDEGIHSVTLCKMLEFEEANPGYQVCLEFNAEQMVCTVDIKRIQSRTERTLSRKKWSFGDILNSEFESRSDSGVDQEFVFMDPVEGNLGYVLWKYMLMDSQSVLRKKEMETDVSRDLQRFDGLIRFNERFEMGFVKNQIGEEQCSVTLYGLPFRMCMGERDKGIILYFVKDKGRESEDGNVVYSESRKEVIDDEFASSLFAFDRDVQWDEISDINEGQRIEKCCYLQIARVCMEYDIAADYMESTISFQLMHQKIV